MKKVAIIIPTYNGKKFIRQTIESCLFQSHKNIEILVIDDCSEDGTLDFLSDFQDKIRIVTNETNQGLVKTINKAIVEIQDVDFVVFLGHDDILPERHIELMIQEFTNSDIVAVHCNSILIDKYGKELRLARDDNEQIRKTERCMYELSLDNFISSCGMMHKMEVVNKIRGWDENYRNYGEWLFYIKELNYGRIKYTTETKPFYRRHETNISNTFKKKTVKKGLDLYKRACRKLAHQQNKNTVIQDVKFYVNEFKIILRAIL